MLEELRKFMSLWKLDRKFQRYLDRLDPLELIKFNVFWPDQVK